MVNNKKINVAFNGFGRIGRSLIRKLIDNENYNIVAINARTTVEVRAHLFKYDSIHGHFNGDVSYELDNLILNGKSIPNFDRKTPSKLPWKELEVDIVVDSTGKFTDKHSLEQHIEAGANNVLVTSPAKDVDATLIYGVNETEYKLQDTNIISTSSCTTTCLSPLLKILQKNFGIKYGSVTTIHSYTMGQTLLDSSHPDLRRARAATMSIIPTSTGAAKNIGIVLPELEGKLDGMAIRVPVPDVSLLDISVELEKDVTVDMIHDMFVKESKGKMNGIIDVSCEPLVSVDYVGSPFSSIIDCLSTKVINKRFLKLLAWYDNEFGYSCRVLDLMDLISKKIVSKSIQTKGL
ncbi:MAG: type I glyceraldehyde-3-phosphate dehydrogenase [Candidatus Pacebacteria bacterium]|jgi:glyceraldehyde 3-phosphate dehydrogenase|nr:type I glyceraldehyde-3-phosphate dehydrogenase [Candidatus Paceibacterota bacterium]